MNSSSCKSREMISMILLILINLIAYVRAQPNICTNNGGYTNNSTYDVNLKAIISTLPLNIPESGYYDSSISAYSSTTAETINALALCRGDQTPTQCFTCVRSAAPYLLTICRNNRQGVVWDDGCLVRYSNAPLRDPSTIQFVLFSGYNASNKEQFKVDRDALLSDLRSSAASGCSKLKVGAGVRSTSSLGSESNAIYGLVQCAPDLSSENCTTCLVEATQSIQSCCDFQTGVRLLKPDCTIQYEIRNFYNATRLSERGVLPS